MPRTTRLAPSPTGALHLGNVRTFLLTWAIARQRGWRIILRVEDLDTPRVKPGAAAQIMDVLTWLGIDWDPWFTLGERVGEPCTGVLVQSEDLEPYRHAMKLLAAKGLAYPCDLTRTQIEAAASAPQEGAHEVPFPNRLRPRGAGRPIEFLFCGRKQGGSASHAVSLPDEPNWRFLTSPGTVPFDDAVGGTREFDPSEIVGDFVLWTKRAQPSYQLAVVVDDHRQGVTDVIRGDDLLDSASRQLLLYRALGFAPEPIYWHFPLVIGTDGRRLAKRHGDTRVEHYRSLGVPKEAIIGLMAKWCGIVTLPSTERWSTPAPMSIEEFKARLDVTMIPRTPIMFTSEDHQWLMSKAR